MRESPVVVAEVVRSGVVESQHHGSVVAVGPDGGVLLARGAVRTPVFPRSCNKPLQAAAMVGLGLRLPPELLALASASHSGEPMHVDGVRRILSDAGLDEDALRTPAQWPLDDDARAQVVRDGGGDSPVLMNCSGKHAAMLATCAVRGWDTAAYTDPDHPLQQAIAATFAELTGEPPGEAAVDGCGAPLFAASLTGIARAFARLALADKETPEGEVAEAIRAHPTMVSGSHRDEAALLAALPGAIGKAGAEGCYAVALPDGIAVALKVADGAQRARPVLMAGVLQVLGLQHPVLEEQARPPVLGGGKQVGEIRPVLS
ncbi:MAG: asparaginase [Actinomycetota bacterium]|nr:asparaginase [Actinomycetota bacterium]